MATIEQLYGHLNTLTKQWFYDKAETDALLDDKLDAVDIPTKISDLTDDSDFIDSTELSTTLSGYIAKSQTVGLVKNDGTIDTNTYLTQHQDISGKANSADLATVATSGSYLDLENIPSTFAPSAHEHSASDVKDSSAYTNLGTSANATQHAINTAIDTKIGSLLSVELIEVASTLPTASTDTMNKLYLVPETDAETNDAYEVFVTVEDTNEYDWEKIDSARIDLTGYALVDHVHGNISNDGKIGSTANQFVYTTTGGSVTAKSTVGNLTTDGAIGSDTGKVVVTTTNGVLTTSDWITEVDNVIQQLNTYGSSLNSGSGS